MATKKKKTNKKKPFKENFFYFDMKRPIRCLTWNPITGEIK